MVSLSPAQIEQLLKPIHPGRVMEAQGHSHLPAFDVIAHLTRIFGFEGWDKEVTSLWLISESSRPNPNDSSKTQYTVTYGCQMRLTIKAKVEGSSIFGNSLGVVKRIEEAATGSANNLPSLGDAHDFAMKNAISYALKRCAKDLGDQFGLSLYNKGQVGGILSKSLAYPDKSDEVEADANRTTPLTLGNDERDQDQLDLGDPQDYS